MTLARPRLLAMTALRLLRLKKPEAKIGAPAVAAAR
jgi:hypothetical protein